MPQFSHGSKAVFWMTATAQATDPAVSPATTGYTNFSTLVKSVSFSEPADTAETSTLGTTAKTYVAGLKDATVSFEGIYDGAAAPTIDSVLNVLLGAEFAWVIIGPQGPTSTYPQYRGKGIITSYEVSAPVDDVVSFTAELQVSGGLTRTTWA